MEAKIHDLFVNSLGRCADVERGRRAVRPARYRQGSDTMFPGRSRQRSQGWHVARRSASTASSGSKRPVTKTRPVAMHARHRRSCGRRRRIPGQGRAAPHRARRPAARRSLCARRYRRRRRPSVCHGGRGGDGAAERRPAGLPRHRPHAEWSPATASKNAAACGGRRHRPGTTTRRAGRQKRGGPVRAARRPRYPPAGNGHCRRRRLHSPRRSGSPQ